MPEGRGFQPTAWRAKTVSHVFKPVVPRADHGMHLSLHKNLNPRYQRPDTEPRVPTYETTFKLMYLQRPTQRVFTAQAPVSTYPVQSLTRRLSAFDPRGGPPGSSLHREGHSASFPYLICNKPLYSALEVEAIVERLYNRKRDEGRCPPRLQWRQRRERYPVDVLEEAIGLYSSTERLCCTQPLRNATRDRQMAVQDIAACERRLSAEQLRSTVDRLCQYDPQRWPPNSKGTLPPEHLPTVRVRYPAQSTANKGYADNIVQRLYRAPEQKSSESPSREQEHRRSSVKSSEKHRYSPVKDEHMADYAQNLRHHPCQPLTLPDMRQKRSNTKLTVHEEGEAGMEAQQPAEQAAQQEQEENTNNSARRQQQDDVGDSSADVVRSEGGEETEVGEEAEEGKGGREVGFEDDDSEVLRMMKQNETESTLI